MEIELLGRVSKSLSHLAENVAKKALQHCGQPDDLMVAIKFVSETEIKRLNAEFRNKDSVTDVLSFPSTNVKAGDKIDVNSMELQELFDGENYHIGDIAICTNVLKRQANDFGVTVEDECKKLVIHSILHLLGYDHIEDADFEIMKKQEDRLSELISID